MKKEEQKQHLIDMMQEDEKLGLYEEPNQRLEKYSERFDNDKSSIGNPNTWGQRIIEEPKQEIKLEDIFNDEKKEAVKRVIHQHKVLTNLRLVNPAHLQMTDNGHGEFPDGYKLTEKGIQYIIEQLNKK